MDASICSESTKEGHRVVMTDITKFSYGEVGAGERILYLHENNNDKSIIILSGKSIFTSHVIESFSLSILITWKNSSQIYKFKKLKHIIDKESKNWNINKFNNVK